MAAAEYEFFPDRYFDDINENYLAPLLDKVLAGHRPRQALDVGCGNGLFGAYVKEKSGCLLSGIDASPSAADLCARAGYDQVLISSDLCKPPLPFDDAAFDFVLCKDVLEHLLSPLNLLREIRRVLRPDGLLLSHVPNHFTLPARLKFLVSNDIDTYRFFPEAHEWDFPHIRFYTRQGFVAMHEQGGMTLERDLSRFFAVRAPKLWRLPGYAAVLGWLDGRFPSSFVTGFTALFKPSSCLGPAQ